MSSLKQQILSASEVPKRQSAILNDNYDPLQDVYSLVSTDLSEIDNYLSKTKLYANELDNQIESISSNLNLNVENDSEINEIKKDLSDVLQAYTELQHLSSTTHSKLEILTSPIRKLDNAKENLIYTMTQLERLQMYITAYDSLLTEIKSQNKDWVVINQMLSVVLELNETFKSFNTIDEIRLLDRQVHDLKSKILDDIFDDLERSFENTLSNSTLASACLALELLGNAYVDKLQNWYIGLVLKELNDIFKPSEEAGGLDNLKRRYSYFMNVITTFENNESIFPKNWEMRVKIVLKFCETTKNDLRQVLSKSSNGINGEILLTALRETLEFEKYLNQKFSYYESFEEYNNKDKKDLNEKLNFNKSISDIFEPYLDFWIDEQAKHLDNYLLDFIKPDMMFKKSADGDGINVFESSAELFRQFRAMLNQLSKLTNGTPLIKLTKIFDKYLNKYKQKILEMSLPDAKSLNNVSGEDLKEGMDIIDTVLNTADYCFITAGQLEDKVKSLIQPKELQEQINFDSSKDGFIKLISFCIGLLIYKIETDLQMAWREFSNANWKDITEVIGESRYMITVKQTVEENSKLILSNINRVIYKRNLIEKLTESILSFIIKSLVKFEVITMNISKQFKFDLQSLKSTIINLLHDSSTVFKKTIDKLFENPDRLLKILMLPSDPLDQFITSYFTIIGDSNFSNFIKIFTLKGLLKNDERKKKLEYMDAFKQQLEIYKIDPSNKLEESWKYLENLTVGQQSNSHSRANSRNISYLPSTIINSGPATPKLQVPTPTPPTQTTSPNGSAWNLLSKTTDEENRFGFFQKDLLKLKEGNLNEGLIRFFKRGE